MTDGRIERMLPLSPRIFAILLALAERPAHGYGLMRILAEREDGWMPGPGTLYRLLKEMEGDGLITVVPGEAGPSDGPPRRSYTLTGFGRSVAGAEGRRMQALARRARELLLADTD